MNIERPKYQIFRGDNRETLKRLPDASIDAVITDPPYEIALGHVKSWDSSGIAHDPELWSQILRVLKPGGHLVAFSATRTYHRLAVSIEDAGFELRDMISWIYSQGFPKSQNIALSIDKQEGLIKQRGKGALKHMTNQARPKSEDGADLQTGLPPYEPKHSDAIKWNGWGTNLKPSQEPAVLARKPLQESSITAQMRATGTGAINIDASRHAQGEDAWPFMDPRAKINHPLGLWPGNIYYCPKPSASERERSLDHLKSQECKSKFNLGNGEGARFDGHASPNRANHHATVKPIKILRWLIRLLCPPGGVVLDPFAGSGSTLAASILEGFSCIGCELQDEYIPIIEGRADQAIEDYLDSKAQLTLWDYLEGL